MCFLDRYRVRYFSKHEFEFQPMPYWSLKNAQREFNLASSVMTHLSEVRLERKNGRTWEIVTNKVFR